MASHSDEFDKIIEFVEFAWVQYETVVSTVATKVIPGRAVREYKIRYDMATKKSTGVGTPKGMLPQDEQIRSGARTLVRGCLINAIKGGMLEMREVDGVKWVRKNRFTAAEVDALIAQHAGVEQLSTEVKPVEGELPYALLFDHRSVQSGIEVQNNERAKQVVLIIKAIIDDKDLVCHFSAPAADWLSDQLGIQAIHVRGAENPRKIVLSGNQKWPGK